MLTCGVCFPAVFSFKKQEELMIERVWQIKQPQPDLCRTFAENLGVSPVISQILINRGISSIDQARAFLGGTISDLHDPFLFPGMDRAAERIVQAIRDGEKILIFGDYDVDGITSVALLIRLLYPYAKRNLFYHIPNRLEEGYGLNSAAIEKAGRNGITLLITVDCGITAVAEIELAKSLGMDVIVSDHHEPPAVLPEALALINPKIPDCPYPFRDLCGAGVAFKLAMAVSDKIGISEEALFREIDLVALATVADMVPLFGENRIIVKAGLERIANTTNEGMKALIAVCGLGERAITTGHLAFYLAPRINAAGRLGYAQTGINLFLATDPDQALSLARKLEAENRERQAIEAELTGCACRQAEELLAKKDQRTLVLAGDNWHHGVLGIVASKIVERFYRPAILIGWDGTEGRGSGRSIQGFHLYHALEECAGHLTRFGGHESAAGLSITRNSLDQFAEAFENHAQGCLDDSAMIPALNADVEIELEQATLELARQLTGLEPFGSQNPEPILVCRNIMMVSPKGVGGNGKHLKFKAQSANARLDGIGFGLGSRLPDLQSKTAVDLAFALEENTWNGVSSAQANVKDLKIVSA
ncbi:MAG TPA: single-stranded-DNA-specific exonuclease RecJ [Firmicutes bacterium]|jgi:single-stranded-DNA-specific exonuclease|nr:single-stranded-DNA-specific exonuclease RecJ [Bacillota bacterium]